MSDLGQCPCIWIVQLYNNMFSLLATPIFYEQKNLILFKDTSKDTKFCNI